MQIQLLRADVTSMNVDALVSPPDVTAGSAGAGGNLLCKFVIRSQEHPVTDEELRVATFKALEKAEELAVGSVGIPPLRAGESDAELASCARAMVAAALEFRHQARSLRRVVFCLFGREPHQAFAQALEELDR